jgi:hypothetical protein
VASSREQPGRGRGVVEDGVALAGRNQFEDEGCQGLGEHGGSGAEMDGDLARTSPDVVDCEAADSAQVLCIEQQ